MAKVVVFYKFAEGAILQTIVEGKMLEEEP